MKNKIEDIVFALIIVVIGLIVFAILYGVNKIEEKHCQNKGGIFVKDYLGRNKCMYGGFYDKD